MDSLGLQLPKVCLLHGDLQNDSPLKISIAALQTQKFMYMFRLGEKRQQMVVSSFMGGTKHTHDAWCWSAFLLHLVTLMLLFCVLFVCCFTRWLAPVRFFVRQHCWSWSERL